jgi:hypothetical protein
MCILAVLAADHLRKKKVSGVYAIADQLYCQKCETCVPNTSKKCAKCDTLQNFHGALKFRGIPVAKDTVHTYLAHLKDGFVHWKK